MPLNFFHRYIYSAVIFPGEVTGSYTLGRQIMSNLCAMQEKFSYEEGFLRGGGGGGGGGGHLLQRNVAWKSFGVSVLK